jgi:hypothetical protein
MAGALEYARGLAELLLILLQWPVALLVTVVLAVVGRPQKPVGGEVVLIVRQ